MAIRSERRAATREALLRAAAKVFARRGFHGASVDAIAAEAGLTIGALYSNFDGKESLFLAVVEDSVRRWAERFDARLTDPGRSLEQRMRGPADAWMEVLHEDPEPFLLYIELWAYAVRNPKLRRRLGARTTAIRDLFTRRIRDLAEQSGASVDDTLAAELGGVFDALGAGLALRKLIDPDGLPDAFFGDAVVHLLTPLFERARRRRPSSARSASR